MPPETALGFAGLGRMGRRMAENCARAGFRVSAWNRSPEPVEALVARCEVDVARSPAALAESSDIVVTMLADDEAARSVYLGEDGLIGAGGASTLVEMGTMSPALARELASAAEAVGKRYVDAPVSGATQAAADAQLLIMAGASQADVPQLSPVFSALGRKTIWLGTSGSGVVMKLAVNTLIHGLNQTLAEALALSGRAGVDPSDAYDVIEHSAAAAPMLTYRRPLYLDERANDVTFTVDLAAKDVGLALELAGQLGVSMPQTRITLSILDEAIRSRYGERDMASIVSYMMERSK